MSLGTSSSGGLHDRKKGKMSRMRVGRRVRSGSYHAHNHLVESKGAHLKLLWLLR